jgi:myo-inositol-1(or 4)-monophosphatase
MPDYLKIAEQLAREAGALLREGYARGVATDSHAIAYEHKGEVDLVTEYDRRCEKVILDGLRGAFPNHAFYAEEAGRSSHRADYEWLVDPLDGTTNFAHAFPFFAVSLALVRHGRSLVGVIYEPLRDELFAAEAGQGAALNGRRLHVSSQADLGHAFLATGFAYDVRTNPRNNFDQFRQFSLRAQGVRRAGSAALDCAYVAAGRLDGYWELGIKPWDVGAGGLLVQEAGGRATTPEADENFLGSPTIVVSNGLIHAQMLRVLREGDAAPRP